MSIELTAVQIAQMAVSVANRLRLIAGEDCGRSARDEILSWLEANADPVIANQAGHLANQMENAMQAQGNNGDPEHIVNVVPEARSGGRRRTQRRRRQRRNA